MAIVFVSFALEHAATGDSLWTTEQEAAAFCESLPSVDDAVLHEALEPYYQDFTTQDAVGIGQLKALDFTAANSIFKRALAKHWGILELVTDESRLPQYPCAFFLDQTSLQQLDMNYDIHSLWMINAPIADNQAMQMRYIIFGAGKLVIGYPQAEVVKVLDYDFFGGKYAYAPYLTAKIVNTESMRGITDIKVRLKPAVGQDNFKGPKSSNIQAIALQENEVEVLYTFLGIASTKTVPRLEIEAHPNP